MTVSSRVAIDVGGTFTDVVTFNSANGGLRFDKVPTTPSDPQQGVINGFAAAEVSLDAISYFIHGTTLGLNALLTRRGAKTGIITTEGFRDVYLLGRTSRNPMYDWKFRKPASLVERRHILEVPERLDFEGNILKDFDEVAAKKIALRAKELELEAVAIVFLHSYVNPSHENKMAKILRETCPDIEVTVSSELSREIREYERTSTAVLDTYIKPIVRRYLSKLKDSLTAKGFKGQFLMTRSGGGAMTVDSAMESPVNLILSGPAGGVLGGTWLARNSQYPNLITIDMGGTSLDASLVVDGQPLTYFDSAFEGLPINLASLYIHTIGAGGGSLVWIDEGDHLQVGPGSAGAEPGPAAYGKGGSEATFTDAALHVGYLGNEYSLAGSLALDKLLAEKALKVNADKLKMSVDEVAYGVLRISTTKIVGAVRTITVELGHDPAGFALLSFGGGGGLCGIDVARELSIPTVIMPPGPGAFSAFGMLMADVQHDFSRTRIGQLEKADLSRMNADFVEMRQSATADLASEGFSAKQQSFNCSIDLRYQGQEHSVTMPVAEKIDQKEIERLKHAFADAHERAYGHAMPDPIEMVALRFTGIGQVQAPELPLLKRGAGGTPKADGERMVYVGNGKRQAYKLYSRDNFSFGDVIEGPAVINEHTATTIMHQGDRAEVGQFGEIVIQVGKVK
ncbi:5-oxoprolinase [freshwater metagenome]|jgi:N-methylhydantoinase A|uniref:5-oxoprolinase n=1 Tax=freshwater metagenome TaxID=449393 RepID=A0A094QFL1_9ZZZZ